MLLNFLSDNSCGFKEQNSRRSVFLRIKSSSHVGGLENKWRSWWAAEITEKYSKSQKPSGDGGRGGMMDSSSSWFRYAECRGMTNLQPKGEWYLIPTSWNTWRGIPMSHRYTRPAPSARERGRQRDNDHLASTAWRCPLPGGSKLSTGARFWLAQSAAAWYQGWSIRNVFSWQSRQLMMRSTGVSGRSAGSEGEAIKTVRRRVASCTSGKTSKCEKNMLTFDTWHLFAASLVKKCDLTGDGVQHLHEIGQKQDDLDLVIAQVAAAADALSPLHVWAAQQSHCGALV